MGATIFSALMQPEDWEKYPDYAKQIEIGQGGDFFEFEYRMKHSHGSWHWLNKREMIFARTPDGRTKQILGTANDISDRKHAEITLQQQVLREQLTSAIAQRRCQSLQLEDILNKPSAELQQALQAEFLIELPLKPT